MQNEYNVLLMEGDTLITYSMKQETIWVSLGGGISRPLPWHQISSIRCLAIMSYPIINNLYPTGLHNFKEHFYI